jgi:class 3 adenylate cyclase
MARLSSAERSALPDRAFAYVDSQGRRRLPIVDAAHVRNALARFGRVEFESAAAREVARGRLLRAAQRFRIVPIGFIDAELRSVRDSTSVHGDVLPSGFVTLMMTDIEGSTDLLAALGDEYAAVLDDVREVLRGAIAAFGGIVVEARADDAFAVFTSPADAVSASVRIHRDLLARRWPESSAVRVRIGLHSGYPTRRHGNYVGMAVHTAARISASAHGGQTVASGDTKEACTGLALCGARFRRIGTHRLRGIPDEVELLQILAAGLEHSFPPLRV